MCKAGAGCGCQADVSAILDVFRVVAPELDDVLNNDVTAMIVFVADMVSKKKFGPYYVRAVAYLAAHFIKLQDMAESDGSNSGSLTADGGITMEKEGDLQRQYGASISGSSNDADILLKKTLYGRMFLTLRKMVIVPVLTRMG